MPAEGEARAAEAAIAAAEASVSKLEEDASAVLDQLAELQAVVDARAAELAEARKEVRVRHSQLLYGRGCCGRVQQVALLHAGCWVARREATGPHIHRWPLRAGVMAQECLAAPWRSNVDVSRPAFYLTKQATVLNMHPCTCVRSASGGLQSWAWCRTWWGRSRAAWTS